MVPGLFFAGFAEPQANLTLRIRGDGEVCVGEHSGTRGMVPKRLWELEEEAMVPLLPSQPVWQVVLSQSFCHFAR